MRIALVGPFPKDAQIKGGVEGVVDALARQLVSDATHEVHVIAPGTGPRLSVEQHGPLTVHRLPRPHLPGFLNYWTIERHHIHGVLRRLRPDVVHFHGCAGWLLGYRGASVLTVHGILEKDVLYSGRTLKRIRSWIIRKVEDAGRRQSSAVILINPYVEAELNSVLGRRRYAIENPIDPLFFEEAEMPQLRQGHVITAGKVCERKNTLAVLRVFRRAYVRNHALYLTVAGTLDDATYVAECHAFIAKNGLSNAVRFVGNLDRSKLAQLYRSGAAHLLLSRQETAPMVIAECMACGVPTVAIPICGIPYMIEPEFTGVLVDPDDDDATAAVIERVAMNTGGFFVPGLIAARARDRFHPTMIIERTLAVYRAALSPG